jgi:transcriptional regulator with PAS, ATPase and Fis domain
MEEVLINIVENMEKGVVFVDEYNTIVYLNKSAKEYYSKKTEKQLIGESVLKFYQVDIKRKIIMAVEMLRQNKSLKKVTIEDTDIYPVWINDTFSGYYKIV